MHALFGILTAIALVVGFTPYIVDVVKDKTKPERASWLIWSVLSAIAFTTQLAEGARWSLVMPGFDFFIVSFIFVLAVKFGEGGLPKRDIASLLIAGLSLVVWALTKEPVTALLIVIGIDATAAWLTIYKSYLQPETETLFSWVLSALSGVFTVLAVNHLRFELLVYPIFIALADSSVVFAILLGRKRKTSSRKAPEHSPPSFEIP